MQSDTSGEELQTEMIENFANGVPWPFMGQALNSNTQTTLRGYLSSYAGFTAKATAEDVLRQVQKTEKLLNKKGPFPMI